MAALDEKPDRGEDLDDANLPMLWPFPGKESYTNVNISENLTCQQRCDVQELVQEYGDISTERPQITQLEHHHTETITRDPIKVKSHLMPYAMYEITKEEVEVMLDADIICIETSKSSYCSLFVIVQKKKWF